MKHDARCAHVAKNPQQSQSRFLVHSRAGRLIIAGALVGSFVSSFLSACVSAQPETGTSGSASSGQAPASPQFFIAKPELKNHSEEPRLIDRPFLWEVRAGKVRSYIFGTIHLGQNVYGALPQKVIGALQSADFFISEMYSGAAGLQEISGALRHSSGNNRILFTAEVWKKLQTLSGASEADLNKTSMANIYLSLAQNSSIQSVGTPLDVYLLILAQGMQKQRLYLETPNEQVGVMNSVFRPEVISRLVNNYTANKSELENTTRLLMKAYVSGDENRLQGAIYNDTDSRIIGADGLNTLLRQRNKTWTKAVAQQLKTHSTFLAVGAGHLVGPENFLQLLKKAGFEVTRL